MKTKAIIRVPVEQHKCKENIERLAEFMKKEWFMDAHEMARTILDEEDFAWDYWRQVEEKIMEDGKGEIMRNYMKWFDGKNHYIGADLEERCTALLNTLPKE